MSRRLPVYLVLDCSGSMSGDPIQAVRLGVKALVADLKNEPYAIETAYLSVIAFESTARQVCPLTELLVFQEPNLVAGGATSLGEALKLLSKCFDEDVNKASDTQKGDWKPLVFLMTDGMPTDSWERAADELKQKKPANIIACAAGANADEYLLKRITEIVVKLDNLQPDTLKAFFKWVTQSIKQTSQSVSQVMADDQPVNLPPPPPQIQIVP
ncbi:MAG: VWA domain-containing protein [Symploca sp. SIO3C6]|uniref:VWA domain-containing protein n=1 Tax=Symploca sp. SIO1C4 TaxID=2607765 RepID=A0A6B3NPA1_9CYAN|nr:VWA domain-containing protein [Symploca sp. SIO3C6]NER31068.1 VWA domain-containing protein [Symploca sp. SIO1C4]NET06879.1 VWA domain-containing protein [Symploca sp. SIO2B6]